MSTQLGAAPASSPFEGRDASSRSASSRSRAWQAFRSLRRGLGAGPKQLRLDRGERRPRVGLVGPAPLYERDEVRWRSLGYGRPRLLGQDLHGDLHRVEAAPGDVSGQHLPPLARDVSPPPGRLRRPPPPELRTPPPLARGWGQLELAPADLEELSLVSHYSAS